MKSVIESAMQPGIPGYHNTISSLTVKQFGNELCTGTRQHPPTHPNPSQESNRLLTEFVARSSSAQLQEEVVRSLQQHDARQQQLQDSINLHSDCDSTISEIKKILDNVRESSPGDDTVAYSCSRTHHRLPGATQNYIQDR